MICWKIVTIWSKHVDEVSMKFLQKYVEQNKGCRENFPQKFTYMENKVQLDASIY